MGSKVPRREPFRVVRRKRAKKEMIKWEKVKVEVRERVEVKVKGVSQVQREDPQERRARRDPAEASYFSTRP